MSQTKHTPGPWEVVRHEGETVDRDICQFVVQEQAGVNYQLAFVIGDVENLKSQAQANAQLMAAAPELLTACELVLSPLSDSEINECWQYKQVRAAIAKAKGL